MGRREASMALIALIAAVLISALLAGCADREEQAAAEPEPKLATALPETAEEAEGDPRRITTLALNAYQFGYEPSTLNAGYGDKVLLTVTSLDVAHGFALPDFGINIRVPPEESVEVIFIADKKGEFGFFNSVYSGKGWKEMKGKLVVE